MVQKPVQGEVAQGPLLPLEIGRHGLALRFGKIAVFLPPHAGDVSQSLPPILDEQDHGRAVFHQPGAIDLGALPLRAIEIERPLPAPQGVFHGKFPHSFGR